MFDVIHVFSWMTSNKLSVNPNKTEYLLFNPSNINPPINTINVNSYIIFPSDSAKNLGVIFQTDMSFDKHISSIVKSCFLQLCDFRRIRPFISKTAAITLANAFVHSHLDFCNSLFYGLPKCSIHRLQKIRITVARIIKYEVQLLASLVICLVFLIYLQLSNFYNGFQYFIVLISKYVM